jgi:predicted nucleic acid-binding protein
LSGPIVYLDASALIKLVVAEPETPALRSFLKDHPDRLSSAISIVEIHRALRHAGARPADHRRANEVLERVALMRVDEATLRQAAALSPFDLRSLDAIHLATALSVRQDLARFICYDHRLRAAATEHKLPVAAPR